MNIQCAHCQTVGDVYFCAGCGQLFFSGQQKCPDDPYGHEGCVIPYDEWFAEQLAEGLKAALAEPR